MGEQMHYWTPVPRIRLVSLQAKATDSSPTLRPAPAPGLLLPRTSNISGSTTGAHARPARDSVNSLCRAGLSLVI
ncbi:hypothetical protein BST61_g6956 [Cercospora zeina]